ncbi:MAG: hypothetical protein V2G42_03465 [bacterium JZ-2024 1]
MTAHFRLLSVLGGAFLAVWALWEQHQRFSLAPFSFVWAVVLGGTTGSLLDRHLLRRRKWQAVRIIRGVSLCWCFLVALWVLEGRQAPAVAVVLEASATLLLLAIPATVWGE